MGPVKPETILTPRQWEFYLALRERRTTADIAAGRARMAPMKKQQQHRYLTQFIQRGIITLAKDNPMREHATTDYPWVPTELIPTVWPKPPAGGRLRVVYSVESTADMTVPPILLIVWPDKPVAGLRQWSVQGVPMRHPNGLGPRHALPTHRSVVVANLTTGTEPDVFLARLPLRRNAEHNHYWSERLTTQHVTADPPLTRLECQTLTLMIAAVVGDGGTDVLHEPPAGETS